jgi:hypothetical protein
LALLQQAERHCEVLGLPLIVRLHFRYLGFLPRGFIRPSESLLEPFGQRCRLQLQSFGTVEEAGAVGKSGVSLDEPAQFVRRVDGPKHVVTK